MLAVHNRIGELEEQVRQLKEQVAELSGRSLYELVKKRLGIPHGQALAFCLLVQRGIASRQQLIDAVYVDDGYLDKLSDPYWSIGSVMKHLRRHVEPLGIEIRTNYGHGWELEEPMRMRAKALLEACQ